MEKAGAVGGAPGRAGCREQLHERPAAAGAEAVEAGVARENLEAEHSLVELGDRVEIGDPEAHRADLHVRGSAHRPDGTAPA